MFQGKRKFSTYYLVIIKRFKVLKKWLVFYLYCRRVHITRATLDELGNKFDVEEGNGGERDEVLAKHNVETFLIIAPQRKSSKNSAKKVSIAYTHT